MQAIVMVHRMQRMTMTASTLSKNSASGEMGGASNVQSNDNTSTLNTSIKSDTQDTYRKTSSSVPPNSPFPSSPKNTTNAPLDCSLPSINPSVIACTTATTSTSTKKTATASVAVTAASASSNKN